MGHSLSWPLTSLATLSAAFIGVYVVVLAARAYSPRKRGTLSNTVAGSSAAFR